MRFKENGGHFLKPVAIFFKPVGPVSGTQTRDLSITRRIFPAMARDFIRSHYQASFKKASIVMVTASENIACDHPTS